MDKNYESAAKAIGVAQTRIGEIVAGRRSISADTALRLSRFFGMEEGFWMRLQLNYEMQRTKLELGKRINAEVKPAA